MWNAVSAPPNDMIDRATSPEGVDRFAQFCCRNPDACCYLYRCLTCCLCCLYYLCAYLPHDNPSRAALMNRFYSHGADPKNKKVRKNTNGRQNRHARQNVGSTQTISA